MIDQTWAPTKVIAIGKAAWSVEAFAPDNVRIRVFVA